MIRHIFALAAVAALTSTSVQSQQTGAAVHHTAAVQPDVRAIGTWEGQFTGGAHAEPGLLRLVVAKDSTWNVQADMQVDGQAFQVTIKDFRVSKDQLTWTQAVMGETCKASAAFVADAIRGETSCSFGTITYLLHKQK